MRSGVHIIKSIYYYFKQDRINLLLSFQTWLQAKQRSFTVIVPAILLRAEER